MPDCQACTESESATVWANYRAACLSCAARSIAQVPEHIEAAKAQQATPGYITLLWRSFGDEWEQGHREVTRWTRLMLR